MTNGYRDITRGTKEMEVIKFAPTRPDYVPLDNIKPQPAKNFIPDWYKQNA